MAGLKISVILTFINLRKKFCILNNQNLSVARFSNSFHFLLNLECIEMKNFISDDSPDFKILRLAHLLVFNTESIYVK